MALREGFGLAADDGVLLPDQRLKAPDGRHRILGQGGHPRVCAGGPWRRLAGIAPLPWIGLNPGSLGRLRVCLTKGRQCQGRVGGSHMALSLLLRIICVL
ncbi:hypothetical protein GCM10011335_19520 [Aureimonas glaciei]|uniref:Uncharacterized protein n=1 Tax=Aureimonas glaciei TaxID=1776957 RepID=A0A916XWD5_9HYPH|nr:hypothetical protein GCM10011335_19520 [Aureimonas glaciei]